MGYNDILCVILGTSCHEGGGDGRSGRFVRFGGCVMSTVLGLMSSSDGCDRLTLSSITIV